MEEVRTARREVREKAFEAFTALAGTKGLSQAEQVERFETAAKALRDAADLADQGAALAKDRDFEASQAEKAKAQEEALAAFAAEVESYANQDEA